MVGRSCMRPPYGTIVSNTISLLGVVPSALDSAAASWHCRRYPAAVLDAAPVVDAQRHHLDGGDVVVDRHIFVVGVHDRGRAGSEDHGRRVAVAVEEARVGGALTAADPGSLAGDLRVVLAHCLRRSDGCAGFRRPARRSRRTAPSAGDPSSTGPRPPRARSARPGSASRLRGPRPAPCRCCP